MQLGFVSAILPDLSLEEVFAFARGEGYSCVEVMCWPSGRATFTIDMTSPRVTLSTLALS